MPTSKKSGDSKKKTSSGKKSGTTKTVNKKPTVKKATAKRAGAAKTQSPKPTAPKKPTASRKNSAASGTSSSAKKPPAGGKSTAKVKSNSRAKPAAAKAKTTTAGSRGAGTKKTSGHSASHRIKPPFPAYKGKLPYAFISYAHADMTEVFVILRKLKESRYRMWFDEGIEPGSEWPEVVGKAVLHSRQVIVFMSPAASKSRNVRNEINLAFSSNKDIIVVVLKKTTMSVGLRLQIGTVQAISKEGDTQAVFLNKIKKNINSAIRG